MKKISILKNVLAITLFLTILSPVSAFALGGPDVEPDFPGSNNLPASDVTIEDIDMYPNIGQSSGRSDLASLIDKVSSYMNMILGLLMGFALLAFVYFVIKYFILPNEDRKQAGSYVMYSIIGFFIILSFWGLVNIVQNTFGLENDVNNSWNSIDNLFPRR